MDPQDKAALTARLAQLINQAHWDTDKAALTEAMQIVERVNCVLIELDEATKAKQRGTAIDADRLFNYLRRKEVSLIISEHNKPQLLDAEGNLEKEFHSMQQLGQDVAGQKI